MLSYESIYVVLKENKFDSSAKKDEEKLKEIQRVMPLIKNFGATYQKPEDARGMVHLYDQLSENYIRMDMDAKRLASLPVLFEDSEFDDI